MSIPSISITPTPSLFSSSNATASLWMQRTLQITKIVMAILAFSAICAGGGRCLQLLSSWLITLDTRESLALAACAQKIGQFLFLTGKYTFLSIAVPVYFTTWVIPKWLIQEGIPQLALLAQRGLIQTVKRISSIVLALCRDVLIPLARYLNQMMIWCWNHLIIPVANQITHVLDQIFEKTMQGISLLYQHILRPIFQLQKQAMIWLEKNLLIPAVRLAQRIVVRALQCFYEYALIPLSRLIQWTWKTVIAPLSSEMCRLLRQALECTIQGLRWLDEYVLIPFARLQQQAVHWIKNSVLIPGIQLVQRTTTQAVRCFYNYALLPFCHLTKWIWSAAIVPVSSKIIQILHQSLQMTIQSFRKLNQQLLVPFLELQKQAIVWIKNQLLIPGIQLIHRITLQAARCFHDYVQMPLGLSAKWVWHSVLIPIGNSTVELCGLIKSVVVETAREIHHVLILPTFQLITATFETVYEVYQTKLKNRFVA